MNPAGSPWSTTRPKKRRLGAKGVAARLAPMDTDLDSQDDGMIEINVDRDAGHVPARGAGLPHSETVNRRQAPADLANAAGNGANG
jgi:hypothetical protein